MFEWSVRAVEHLADESTDTVMSALCCSRCTSCTIFLVCARQPTTGLSFSCAQHRPPLVLLPLPPSRRRLETCRSKRQAQLVLSLSRACDKLLTMTWRAEALRHTSSAGVLSREELALGRRESSRDDLSSTHVLDRSQRPTKPTRHTGKHREARDARSFEQRASIEMVLRVLLPVPYPCLPRRGGAACRRRRARTPASCAGRWASRSCGPLCPTRGTGTVHHSFYVHLASNRWRSRSRCVPSRSRSGHSHPRGR